MKADFSENIWAFGVTMYSLHDGLLLSRLSSDNKTDNIQKGRTDCSRLRHWEGIQKEHILRIILSCINKFLEKLVVHFLKQCLHKDKGNHFKTMKGAPEDHLFCDGAENMLLNTILPEIGVIKRSIDDTATAIDEMNKGVNNFHGVTFNMLQTLLEGKTAPSYIYIVTRHRMSRTVA